MQKADAILITVIHPVLRRLLLSSVPHVSQS